MWSESGARARNDTLRSRAALGYRSAGNRTGPRGVRSTGQAQRRAKHPPRPSPGNAGLGLSQMWLRLRWRMPQWSAGRRARPDSARCRAASARPMIACASRRSAPSTSGDLDQTKLGRKKTRREEESRCPHTLPRRGRGSRPEGARGGASGHAGISSALARPAERNATSNSNDLIVCRRWIDQDQGTRNPAKDLFRRTSLGLTLIKSIFPEMI